MTLQDSDNPKKQFDTVRSSRLSTKEIKNHNLKTRSAILWLLSTTIIWQSVSWLLTLLTARILKVTDYGTLAVSEACFTYLMMLTTLGIDVWLVQKEEHNENTESSAQTLLLILGCISATISFLLAPFLADLYQLPEIVILVKTLSITLLLRSLQIIPEARLRRKMKFKPIALCNLTVGILRSIIQLALAYYGFGYWSLVVGIVFKEILTLVWFILCSGTVTCLSFDRTVLKEALSFGLTSTGSTVFWIIFSTSDNLIIGKLFGMEILGYYSMAFFLAELPLSKLNSFLTPVLIPYFSKLKYNSNALRKAYLRTNKTIVGLIAPILFGVALTAPQAIPLILGEKWAPMVLPLQVLSVVGLLRGLSGNTSPLLLATGHPQKLLWWSVLNAIVLPLAFFIFGSHFGINGIYLSWLLVYPLSGLFVLLHIVRGIIFLSPWNYLYSLRAPIISSVLMFCGGTLISIALKTSMTPIALLILNIVTGIILYASCSLYLFKQETLRTIAMIRKLRRNAFVNKATQL